MKRCLIAVLCTAILSGSAYAGPTLFSDNFDSENGGNYQLDYTGFANWTVSDGSVDLIGAGSTWDWFGVDHGLYVDMDGSTSPKNAGKMTSTPISLAAGTYLLSFDLAGNQRNNASEEVTAEVLLGSLFSKSYSLGQHAPFQTFTEIFTVPTDQDDVELTFEGAGGDNIGMLLDNVAVSVVPAPGAFLLGSLGAGLVGWLRKRKSL